MASGSHPVFARVYQRMSTRMDEAGVAGLRRELVAGLSGRVIEVGAGNGLMFPHYPAQVAEVLAVEPEPHLRAAAVAAARGAPVPITVVAGHADRLPAADGEFDAAVTAYVLCSVPGLPTALAELRRVLRSDGELRFLEHVLDGGSARMRRAQRWADATVWPFFFGGCHTARDTAGAIAAAGFELGGTRTFRFPPHGPATPSSPHVLGRAVSPRP